MTHPALDPAAWSDAVSDQAVWVADGSQVKVTVRNGHLHVADGVPGQLRERTLARVPRRVTRLVILARRGYISLEALRWMQATNVQVTHIAEDITMTSGSHEGDARVITAQVEPRLDVARYLITEKIWNQGIVLETELRNPVPAAQLRGIAETIPSVQPVELIRSAEGSAAKIYWAEWRGIVGVPWSPADLLRVPEHWRSFPGRPTLLREWESNRNATDPVNAMLNYVYKVLESECINACRVHGLHPDLGVLHVKGTDRHAFVLDLMEPVRPFCDKLVLQYLGANDWYYCGECGKAHHPHFDRNWCHEERNGKCVLDPPLTHVISGWAADIGAKVQPYAERVRLMLS